MVQFSQQGISVMWAICGFAGLKTMKIKAVEAMGATLVHLVHYQKTYAAPFGIICPQLRGAWSEHEQTCKIAREDLPHPLKQRQDELRKGKSIVSATLAKAPHFCRLLFWIGLARNSLNYSGCLCKVHMSNVRPDLFLHTIMWAVKSNIQLCTLCIEHCAV